MNVKKYIASSALHISVVLKSGKSHHISFVPNSGGKSFFITGDEDLQYAIEHNANFGRLFTLDKTLAAMTDKSSSEDNFGEANKGAEQGEKKLKQVTVSDLSAARDYLAETFPVSRTKIKTKPQILACAAGFGIEFIGLE